MSRFAIRDDDVSFFTQVSEIQQLYDRHLGTVPISFGVVPIAIAPGLEIKNSEYCTHELAGRSLVDNENLVGWLKEQHAAGNVDIMLHGYTHQYKLSKDRFVPEFQWKSESEMRIDVESGLQYLEGIFGERPQVFVPPSNGIGANGVRILREQKLKLSGLCGTRPDRPVTSRYVMAWTRRTAWRLTHGQAFPGILRYDGSVELRAYALTQVADLDALFSDLRKCSQAGFPFVVATHYWELAQFPHLQDTLWNLVDLATSLGMQMSTVNECFEV